MPCCETVCDRTVTREVVCWWDRYCFGNRLDCCEVRYLDDDDDDDGMIYLTLRRLMSYIYGAPILDVSRSHTTTQHSR